ncbi:HK97 family phage prohead protease [Acuticoccus sediminis]|uniref:HK97 family phage prohead protease n=1 Tax=Acuticoccus sediminis TaxID=2184697 RepID=UPI001CFD18DB|nr:HK97 family phage prohead protease [Acuticoccus sediminis]
MTVPDTLWRTAVHEAGHAAAAVTLLAGCSSVTITPGTTRRGDATIATAGMMRRRPAHDNRTLLDREARIAVCLAAAEAAEAAFGFEARPLAVDDEDLRSLAGLMQMDTAGLCPGRLAVWAAREAQSLVRRHHDLIEDIATELYGRTTLDGKDVDAIASRHGVVIGTGRLRYPEVLRLIHPSTEECDMPDITRTRRAPTVGTTATRLAPGSGVRPTTYDATARTVDAIIATPTPVRRWFGLEVLSMDPADVDLSRVDTGVVRLLDSHDASTIGRVLGTVESVRLDGEQAIATIAFADTDAGREAEAAVAGGVVVSLSVGYEITSQALAEVGQAGAPNVYRCGWRLLEVSLVSVPADPNARVRSAVEPRITSAERRARMQARQQRAAEMALAAPGPQRHPRGEFRRADGTRFIAGDGCGFRIDPIIRPGQS